MMYLPIGFNAVLGQIVKGNISYDEHIEDLQYEDTECLKAFTKEEFESLVNEGRVENTSLNTLDKLIEYVKEV